MKILMNSCTTILSGARMYGGIGSVTGNNVLKITSFNCRGFKSSVEDIKALV